MPSEPRETAEQLYAVIPHALPLHTRVEYGLDVSDEQAQYLTREMLSLNLYWIYSALSANLPARDADRVFRALQRRIEAAWDPEFMLQGHDVRSYWIEMKDRRTAYDEMVRSGGTPLSLYLKAVSFLESAQAVHADDRQRVLALFIDLIPEDAIGEMATAIELSDPDTH
ncbi:MAG TPA: hypothetical protein VJ692_07175 [Nitrospiraceae bacterium]|nr:hypothetical protein [Nitrospiraceae bacterium]